MNCELWRRTNLMYRCYCRCCLGNLKIRTTVDLQLGSITWAAYFSGHTNWQQRPMECHRSPNRPRYSWTVPMLDISYNRSLLFLYKWFMISIIMFYEQRLTAWLPISSNPTWMSLLSMVDISIEDSIVSKLHHHCMLDSMERLELMLVLDPSWFSILQ